MKSPNWLLLLAGILFALIAATLVQAQTIPPDMLHFEQHQPPGIEWYELRAPNGTLIATIPAAQMTPIGAGSLPGWIQFTDGTYAAPWGDTLSACPNIAVGPCSPPSNPWPTRSPTATAIVATPTATSPPTATASLPPTPLPTPWVPTPPKLL